MARPFSLFFLSLFIYQNNTGQTEYTREIFGSLQVLVGVWKMDTDRGTILEEWSASGSEELTGKSYRVRNGDTILSENIRIQYQDKMIYYIPQVRDQNNGLPVTFKLIGSKDLKYTFENKEHDFPQRIIYQLVSKDSLHARIEGNNKGKEMGYDFNYSRVR